MRPRTDLKFTFPQNLSTYLSNKISHKFGLRWNTKPLLAHGLLVLLEYDCKKNCHRIGSSFPGKSPITQAIAFSSLQIRKLPILYKYT